MRIAYTVRDRERATAVATGVFYHVRHMGSGRWYWERGRFRSHFMSTFDGLHDALREMRRYFRETEIAGMELVPYQQHGPSAGCEAEAAALLEAGPRPLLPEIGVANAQ